MPRLGQAELSLGGGTTQGFQEGECCYGSAGGGVEAGAGARVKSRASAGAESGAGGGLDDRSAVGLIAGELISARNTRCKVVFYSRARPKELARFHTF